jgi:8-oxo-dGTP pyrophosphatase MutT (NUDIX family)
VHVDRLATAHSDGDELLDLVDCCDRVVGVVLRSAALQRGIRDIRVVNAFLINQSGEIWIPRRSATKRRFPLCLDMSIGGYVMSGETYESALVRESQEELGIDILALHYEDVGAYSPYVHDTSSFMRVFLVYSENTPTYDSSEFCEDIWIKPLHLLGRILDGDKAKEDLPILLRLVFSAAA